ncbi:MAG: hypothetical protein ACRD2E_11565 [Terriglobales bacterium]
MPRPTMPYRTAELGHFGGLYTEADPRWLPPGASPRCQDCDFVIGSAFMRPGTFNIASFAGTQPSTGWRGLGQATVGAGSLLSFVLDASGNLFYEDAASPGAFSILAGAGARNAALLNFPFLTVLAANTRAYLFGSSLVSGAAEPCQWDGAILERVSRCGPGAAPTTLTPATGTSFGATAWQLGASLSVVGAVWGTSAAATPVSGNNLYLLFGSTGNTTQFNVGDYVYLAGMPALGGGTAVNGTYQIASTGTFSGQEYIQVVLREAGAVVVSSLSSVTVQRTRAALALNPAGESTTGAFTSGGLVVLNSFPGVVLNNQFTISVPVLANLGVTQTSLTTDVVSISASLIHGTPFWWIASTPYVLGQQVAIAAGSPVTGPANVWVAIKQGTSGATPPSWPSSPSAGTTIADGGVTWAFVPNLRMLATIQNTANGSGAFNQDQVAIGGTTGITGGVTIQFALTQADIASASESGSMTVGGGSTFEIEPALWTLGHPDQSPIFGSATGNVTGTGQANQQALPPSQPPPGPQQVVALAAIPSSVSPIVRGRVVDSNPIARAFSVGAGPILDPPAIPGTMLPSALGDVAPGNRWAVCMFLTKSGHITPASPPAQFSPVGGYVQFAGLPIGPPDTIARIIAFTQANAAVGGPYFYVPQDTLITSMNIAVPNISGPDSNTASTATSTPNQPQVQPLAVPAANISGTIIWDNTSASTPLLTLSDTVLVASANVSADGQNYLRTRELGACVAATQYSARNFYFGERMQIYGLVNPTFDGGYVGSAASVPAGWEAENLANAAYAVVQSLLLPDACFAATITNDGSAPLNPTGTLLSAVECIAQTACLNEFNAPIVLPNTGYGVRVIGAGANTPALVVELYSANAGTSWPITANLAAVPNEYTGALGNPMWETVPADLQLRVYATNLPAAGSLTIERIELYDVKQPVWASRVIASYANDPEGIDAVSGAIDVSQWTSEPVRACFRWMSNLVIATDSFTFMATDNGTSEPSGWTLTVASDQIGCLGPRAWCLGNEFVIIADRNGVYTFDGGNHVKMSAEIQSLYNTRYVASQATVWLANDLGAQRLYVGIPLVLPNTWLPFSAADPTPALPNTILICDYYGLMSGSELAGGVAVSPSMFTGSLLYRDGRRKWCPWTITSAAGELIRRSDGSMQFWLPGDDSVNVNALGGASDNGVPIPQRYCSYAFNDKLIRDGLQWGDLHKLYAYLTGNIEGAGSFVVTAYPDTLASSWPVNMPGYRLASPAQDDINLPLNMRANRMFFEFATDLGAGSQFRLNSLVIAASMESKILVTGR